MVFHNEDELKQYLLVRCKKAMIQMQREIHELIHAYLREFYHEFSPSVYERTYELFNSLVKSKIEQTTNGFQAVVYFDTDAMNHVKSTWSEEEIMKTAMIGKYPHGGYAPAGGTGIWTKTKGYFDSNDMFDHFKQYLINNGIPVK